MEKNNRNPAGDKWNPGQSLGNRQSWQDLDITSLVQIQPGDVPENLRNVGTPTSELPAGKPSLLDQHPFSVLVFDTNIHLLP